MNFYGVYMARECMDCGTQARDAVGRMCPECDGPMEGKLLYQVDCETCDAVGVHESRSGAEGRAERHVDRTGHDCEITVTSPRATAVNRSRAVRSYRSVVGQPRRATAP
jgi:hypothetical protein